ncbi:MAG: hypothetical protein Q9227_005754 [Pyrenula ochraceoflavens]
MVFSWLSSFWARSSEQPNPVPQESSLPQALKQQRPNPPIEDKPKGLESPSFVSQSSPETQPTKNRGRLLFTAGAAFTVLSLLVTRRSFARRRLALPASPNKDSPGQAVAQTAKVSGALDAFEALNIATINVLSLAIMGFGGTLWYLGINDMQDARRVIRGGLGVDGSGRSEKDAEEEFEEWLASTLARKEAKKNASDHQDPPK